MKIKQYEVRGLNGGVDFSFDFHDDLNILTGLNGSGKTTALKFAWYLISGSTIRIRREIEFRWCRIVTDKFELILERLPSSSDISYSFHSFADEHRVDANFNEPIGFDSDGGIMEDGEDHLSELIRALSDKSIYFPTFRRIEGGYSILKRAGRFGFGSSTRADSGLGEQLEQITKALSNGDHKFVCAISTEDIAALLTQRYAQISEGVNKKYADFSSMILRDIRAWEHGDTTVDSSSDLLLRQIQDAANEVDAFRELTLKPFNVLSELVAKLFSYQGVKVKGGLALGDAAQAIDSDILSAGEKQMLSFLVYNAFAVNTPIFIDEPELSLHPDWQRRLFPTLLDQQSSNQFIVSTHSPFIYAKYSDRELMINADRGD